MSNNDYVTREMAVKIYASEIDDQVDLCGKIDQADFKHGWQSLIEDLIKHEDACESRARKWKCPKLSKDGTRVIR